LKKLKKFDKKFKKAENRTSNVIAIIQLQDFTNFDYFC